MFLAPSAHATSSANVCGFRAKQRSFLCQGSPAALLTLQPQSVDAIKTGAALSTTIGTTVAEIRLAHRTAEVHAGPAATHTRRRRSLTGLNVRWKKEAPLRSRGFFVVCGYAARRVSTRSTAFQRA